MRHSYEFIQDWWTSKPLRVSYSEWFRWSWKYMSFDEDDLRCMDEMQTAFEAMAATQQETHRAALKTVSLDELFGKDRTVIACEKMNTLPDEVRAAPSEEERQVLKREYNRFVYHDAPQQKYNARQVKEEIDIVDYIGEDMELKKAGNGYKGRCPFHKEGKERTPSFFVSRNKKLWYCFACGEGGDLFSYIEKRDNIPFASAVKEASIEL